MAFTDATPVTLNITCAQGLAQSFKSTAVRDSANAVVDLSAWTNLTAKAVPLSPGPASSDNTFGTVTASALGIITVTTAVADFAVDEIGSAKLIITGKPTSGDEAQLLASGALTVIPA